MSKKKHIAFALLMNGLIPWVLYVWLAGHMSSLNALTIATLVPLTDNLFYLFKHKKLDAFGSLMLFTFLFTLALVFMGGSEKLLLIRESLITASVGFIFLISLLFKRPLMFFMAMRFTVGSEAREQAAFSARWDIAYFRKTMRIMSAVWGIVFVLEAGVRTFLVYQLSTAEFLLYSNVVLYGFVGFLILWTAVYRKHAGRRLNQIILNRGV